MKYEPERRRENGSPVRVIIASATTGICLLNSAVANGGVRHLKTGSLCRLIACISQVFQGRDASVHPNGENLNPDAGNDVASSIFSAPTRRPSFVELDSMWVYVTPCMGQKVFIALVCTPGYTHQNAEVILSIIADALLSAMKDPQLHRAVHNVCDESIAASDNYTANSSMSAQSTEPVQPPPEKRRHACGWSHIKFILDMILVGVMHCFCLFLMYRASFSAFCRLPRRPAPRK